MNQDKSSVQGAGLSHLCSLPSGGYLRRALLGTEMPRHSGVPRGVLGRMTESQVPRNLCLRPPIRGIRSAQICVCPKKARDESNTGV